MTLASDRFADLVPVILAGGSGTRLWPVSRAAFPKHLVELVGEQSLLQATAGRLARAAANSRLLTVGAAGQAVLLRRQLAALDPALADNLLLEPDARNTAAAVAYAALQARAQFGPDAILWICPSDHLILDVDTLLQAVASGLPAAREGWLVTFGITPSRPETGFGWIAAGEPLDGMAGVFAVQRFVEKPPLAEAQAMLSAGSFVWNSGMFLMRAQTIIDELEAHAPDILRTTEQAVRDLPTRGERMPAREPYRAIPSAPIDKAVMERSSRVAMVPCDPQWSDVGSWQALWELMPKDDHGNAVIGDVEAADAANNYVRSEHRLVALAGVRDLVVIETADAVLVGDLARADAVKQVVGSLAARQRREAGVHAREHRPWGMFTNLAQGSGFRVREVEVEPGGQLTLQRHDGRDEHWVVVSGRALVRIGSSSREYPTGSSVYVPQGTLHRLANAGDTPLKLIEVQLGQVLGEEATVRVED